jgi:hypothetical protein
MENTKDRKRMKGLRVEWGGEFENEMVSLL